MFGNYTISNECTAPNHVCEVYSYDIDPSENFQSDRSDWQDRTELRILCMIFLMGGFFHILSTSLQSAKFWNCITTSFYVSFSGCLFITVLVLLTYAGPETGPETCSFMRWCHEGIDGQIIPSVYFYQMNECPKSSSTLTYYDYDDDHLNDQCIYTEYGCCEIWGEDQLCDTSYKNGDSYSLYLMDLKRNRSHWALPVEKSDEEGSNCPTIEELIYKVQKEDSRRNNGFWIAFTIIYVMIMYFKLLWDITHSVRQFRKASDLSDSEELPLKAMPLKESV